MPLILENEKSLLVIWNHEEAFSIVTAKLFSQCVDFASQTGLSASCTVFMINVVSSSLVDGLASSRKEGFRFISVSSLDSVENTTGSSTYTRLLSSVLCMALSVRFYTKNRCFDIWQVIHPLNSLLLKYSSMKLWKKQPLIFIGKSCILLEETWK